MNAYLLFAIVAAALSIWALVSVSGSSLNQKDKVLWFIMVILFPIIGPIYYFLKTK